MFFTNTSISDDNLFIIIIIHILILRFIIIDLNVEGCDLDLLSTLALSLSFLSAYLKIAFKASLAKF
jgi:hypothetical protein